jgi:hypothetical protein
MKNVFSATMSERDQPIFSVQAAHAVSMVHEKHRYETIALREFKSTIPPHLIAHLPEDERFIVNTVSKLDSQYAWMMENVVRHNGAALDLDERVTALEGRATSSTSRLDAMAEQTDKVNKLWDWKQFFSGKWAVIAGLALIAVSVALKFLLDVVFKWIKP